MPLFLLRVNFKLFVLKFVFEPLFELKLNFLIVGRGRTTLLLVVLVNTLLLEEWLDPPLLLKCDEPVIGQTKFALPLPAGTLQARF